MDSFSVKLGITLLFSVGVFILMLRSQKKKQRDADRQFDLTLKARGLKNHIEPDLYDPFQKKFVSRSEMRRVTMMAQERLDLEDIKCPLVEHAETLVERAEVLKKSKKKLKKISKKKSKKKGKKS